MSVGLLCTSHTPDHKSKMMLLLAVVCAAIAGGALGTTVTPVMPTMFNPGDQPPAFSVALSNGSTFAYTPPAMPTHVTPIVVMLFNRNSSLHQFMWADNSSLDDFLAVGARSASANYLVISANAAKDLSFVQARFNSRLALLPAALQAQWRSRVAFAAQPVQSLPAASFIAPLLQQWNTTMPVLNSVLEVGGKQKPLFTFGRIDARFDFLPSGAAIYGNSSLELVYLGAACDNATSLNVTGRVVLVELNANCDAFVQATVAISLNAIGMLLFDPVGQLMPEINCHGDECNDSLYGSFFAATIERTAGAKLKALLQTIAHVPASSHILVACKDERVDVLPRASSARLEPTVRCQTRHVPIGDSGVGQSSSRLLISFANPVTIGSAFAIDGGNLRFPSVLAPVQGLREVGGMLYPSLVFYGWADQGLTYQQQRIDDRLRTLMAGNYLIVPTLAGEKTGGIVTTYKNITMPSVSTLLPFNKLFLEFELECWAGTLDRECPIWDRIVSVWVQCGGEQFELGRWINEFRRRNGRWITDASAWLPALRTNLGAANECQFSINIYTINNKYWAPYLNLLFVQDQSIPVTPLQVTSLWPYGYYNFNSSYASLFPPVTITSLPAGTKRVEIAAIITGHGSDSNGCGEFCNQTHTFWLQPLVGAMQSKSFSADEAGTQYGCADQVPFGVQPNGYGTWEYGRGMWCNGRQVDPLIWDVTNLLLPSGSAVLVYNATNAGHPPNGSGGIQAYVDFEAVLVAWG